MADSKAVLERNIHVYDEVAKWQLPEPTALISAKVYREKCAMPFVERLKDIVKSATMITIIYAEIIDER